MFTPVLQGNQTYTSKNERKLESIAIWNSPSSPAWKLLKRTVFVAISRHFMLKTIILPASKKKVPSKPKGKNVSKPSVQPSASATEQSSLGEPPAGSDMTITKYLCRCSYGFFETFVSIHATVILW